MNESQVPTGSDDLDTETRIFDAALRVFARKGRDGARLQEIADEAGIHRPLLHYYFRTKQQLYEAVAERMFNQFLASFDAPAEGGRLADMLRAFIDHYIDSVGEHPHAAMWMVTENMAGQPRARRDADPGFRDRGLSAAGHGRGHRAGDRRPARSGPWIRGSCC